MKVSGVYGAAEVLLPNAEKAAMAAIDAMEYFGGSGFDPDNVDF